MSERPHVRVASSAEIADSAEVGSGTAIWDLAVVREGARIGAECIVGRGAFIDTGVVVGDRCKIQNGALLYAPAHLEAGVFIGPAVVLTNDRFPRAVTPAGALKSADDWRAQGVNVRRGASIGASATVIGGVSVGRWALVAAGSTVTRDVPAYALVAGSPARRIGWVGPNGQPLESRHGAWWCAQTDEWFDESDDGLTPR